MCIRRSRLLAAWIAALLAGAAQAQAPADSAQQGQAEPPRKSSHHVTIPYSGGGIRGRQDLIADGSLVTESEAQEFQGEAGYLVPLPVRSRSLRPELEILEPRPAPGQKVKAPFTLAVRFSPSDSAFDPATFRVLYGAARADITGRVTGATQVGPEGFSLQGVRLPPGRHALAFEVQDGRGRIAKRELRLEVE